MRCVCADACSAPPIDNAWPGGAGAATYGRVHVTNKQRWMAVCGVLLTQNKTESGRWLYWDNEAPLTQCALITACWHWIGIVMCIGRATN